MSRTLSLAIAFFFVTSHSLLAYSVQVNKVPDFPRSFSRLAMLPASCPADVDCLWVESLIVEKLVARGIRIIPAAIVRQRMFELEIKEVTPENLKALSEKLGVDAFVLAAINSMGTEDAGTTGVFIGNIFTAVPSKRNLGSVQLAIVSAQTGKALMEGTGFGESTARPKRGVIGKTFNLILDRTFTAEFFAERAKK